MKSYADESLRYRWKFLDLETFEEVESGSSFLEAD